MRKLMWFTIGFVAGCVPGAYLLWNYWFAIIGILALAAAVVFCFLKEKWSKCAAVILIGLSFSTAWMWGYDAFYLQTARAYDGQTVNASVEIADYSYDTNYGIAADGYIVLDGKSFRVIVYLNKMEQLSPGDSARGDFSFRLTVNGGQREATHHRGKGVFLLAYSEGQTAVERRNQVPEKYMSAKLRRNITDVLDQIFPEDTVGFVRALLLGDGTKLTYEEDTAFKISGIRHVIAVSGLHVSILFALVYLLSGKRRVATALLGIPVLFLFAAVAGFTPSILRACIMQVLMILAMLFKREYDPPTALSFAVLVMLLANPMTVTSVSFQLSVGCMVGIFLFCRPITDYLLQRMGAPKGMSVSARLRRWLAGGVAVTLSAMSVTTPLSAFYFGSVSVVGILTNLATLWAVTFVFYGIMLACGLGALWIPVGRVVAWLISWFVRYILAAAKILASVPIASVYTCSAYILLWLILTYVLLAAFLISKKIRPGILAASITFGLVISIAASWVEPALDPLRVTIVDVGQGQSILLQSHGKRYLVDCGGTDPETAADTVAAQLLSQGVFQLDGLILTHYDEDHAGAAEYLLSRVNARTLYLPDIPDDGDIKRFFADAYSERIQWIDRTEILTGSWGKLSLIFEADAIEENESCLCVLFQTENCDILITGDRSGSGERALLDAIDLPKLELLVVGHHGAGSSTSFELLSVTQPKTAVISVGKGNSYGHPSEDVLERLKMFGCRIWRTDQDGTIIFRR